MHEKWMKLAIQEALKGKGYKIGDEWLRQIARRNRKEGIPTLQDLA